MARLNDITVSVDWEVPSWAKGWPGPVSIKKEDTMQVKFICNVKCGTEEAVLTFDKGLSESQYKIIAGAGRLVFKDIPFVFDAVPDFDLDKGIEITLNPVALKFSELLEIVRSSTAQIEFNESKE